MVPDDRRYTPEHEWVRPDGDGLYTVGITDYAAGALGDVVYVDLPHLGGQLASGAVVGEVESTKSVSEIYAPLSGQVVERNDALTAQPDLVNSDPFGQGWIVKIQAGDATAYDELISPADYDSLIASAG